MRTTCHRRATLGLFAACLHVHCSTPRPVAQDARSTSNPESVELREQSISWSAELTYTVPTPQGGTTQVHSPIVDATIQGVPARLIVDTGSSDTLLTATFAEELGVTLAPEEPGTDHSGASVETFRSNEPVALEIAGMEVALQQVLIIDGPEVFDQWGIAGVVSPQALRQDLSLVVDLRAQRLEWSSEPPEVLLESSRRAHPELQYVSAPRHIGTGDGERLPVIEAAAPPAGRLSMVLNTGTPRCEFEPGKVPHLSGGEEVDQGAGVSGQKVRGFDHEGQALVIAEHRIDLGLVRVREQGEHFEGQVGMDVLRGSIFIIPAEGKGPIYLGLPDR